MTQAYLLLRQHVREMIQTEWQNLETGIHRPGAKRTGEIQQRDERIFALRRFMAAALAAAAKSGYAMETVEARLTALGLALEHFTQWWQHVPDDDLAEEILCNLGMQIEDRLAAVMNIAAAIETKEPAVEVKQRSAEQSLLWEGGCWTVVYAGKTAKFPVRRDSRFRYLARLLCEPYRSFKSEDFFPRPPGVGVIPLMGNDDANDRIAIKNAEDRIKQLAEAIKESEATGDNESATTERIELEKLIKMFESEKKARKRGHKPRCGSLPPNKKADQTLTVAISELRERLSKAGLPELANHLEAIKHVKGEWSYSPPPGTPLWIVTQLSAIPIDPNE